MKTYRLLTAISCLFFISCGNRSEMVVKKDDFADITEFLNREKSELGQGGVHFIKTVDLNGTRQTKSTDHFDWNRELKPFYECDLNMLAMINDYRTDTLLKGDTTKITYTGIATRLKVSSMTVTYHANDLQSIEIRTSATNPWLMLERSLYYQKHLGYSLAENRKMTLSGEDSLNISVTFKH